MPRAAPVRPIFRRSAFVSQSSDPLDTSIPVLTDVVVSGHASHAKAKRSKRSAAPAHPHEDAPVLHDVIEPTFHSAPEPAFGAALEPLLEPVNLPSLEPVLEPARFMPGEAEFTSGSIAERYVPPPDMSAAPVMRKPGSMPGTRGYEADVLAGGLTR